MENDPNTTITLISILKWVGSIIGSVLVGLAVYSFGAFRSRIKSAEKKITDLELNIAVQDNSFSEFRLYRDKKDDELEKLLGSIISKIDTMKKDFGAQFNEINKSITNLKIQNAAKGAKNGK